MPPGATAAVPDPTAEDRFRELAEVAVHELAAPVRVLAGYAGLLGERCGDRLGPEAAPLVAGIAEAAERLAGVFDALRSYAGAEAGPIGDVDLGAALAGVLSGPRLEGLCVDAEPLPVVRARPGDVAAVLVNLLENALRFRSSRPPRVRISASAWGDKVVVSVQDNGLGVPPGERERIFAPFERGAAAAGRRGSGLGLAICERIVAGGGGRIWVEAAPGGGSVFRFTLAAARPQPAGSRPGQHHGAAGDGYAARGGTKAPIRRSPCR